MRHLRDLITNKSQLKFISAVITMVIMVAVVIFMVGFKNRISKYAFDTEAYHTEVDAMGFSALLDDQIRLVESMAGEFGAREPGNEKEYYDALSMIGDLHFFGKLRYADKEGKLYGSDGTSYESNVTGIKLYEDALNGQSGISKELAIDVSDYRLAIVFAAPVYMKNEITGVMLAYMYEENFTAMIDELDDIDDNILVMDSAFNIIGKIGDKEIIDMKNKFDHYLWQFKYLNGVTSSDVKKKLKNREEINYPIMYDSVDYLLSMVPLKQEGWCLVRIQPMEVIKKAERHLMSMASLFSLLVIVAFGILFYISYASASNMIELEKLNSQYSLLDNLSKSVTFSYNPNSRAVDLSGAVEQTLGKEIANMGTVNLVSLLDRLHESDQGLSKTIAEEVRKGKDKYDTEIRIREKDGSYSWYKLSSIIIRDRSGRVEKIIGNLKNSEDQIAKEHVLRNKAETDLLTGLLNKMTMENSVSEILKRRPYSTFAFYILDMDNFKAVNDNLGHAIGDKVLVDVANKLTLLFNEFDYIGRLGGDEFAVMLVIPENMSNYSSRLIELKAKSLCENLRETYSDDNKSVTVTSSIGIAIYSKDGKTFEELYKHADIALYHSKNNGKNRFTFYSEDLEKK